MAQTALGSAVDSQDADTARVDAESALDPNLATEHRPGNAGATAGGWASGCTVEPHPHQAVGRKGTADARTRGT